MKTIVNSLKDMEGKHVKKVWSTEGGGKGYLHICVQFDDDTGFMLTTGDQVCFGVTDLVLKSDISLLEDESIRLEVG